MTGLFASNGNGFAEGRPPSYLHDVEDRYEELLENSREFVINQFGLSTFTWDGGCYKAKTFNFYTFPRPFEEWSPRFLSEAGSLEFLSEHGFDFNKWIRDGISFMPGTLRDKKLTSLDYTRQRNEIVPVSEEDKMMVADLKLMVRKWLHEEESSELYLNPVNSFQRALQYQELRKDQFGASDAPGFYTEKVIVNAGRAFIKLVRASSEEVRKREERLLEQRRKAVHDAAGFAAVMDMIRDSRKPAVGHNLAFDVAYSLNCFVSPLPLTWEEYRQLVQWQFPGGVFDTKHIATNLFGASSEPIDTGLGSLFNLLTIGDSIDELQAQLNAAGISPRADLVVHAEGFDRYLSVAPGGCAHEAGYDAFMTGTVFACLVHHATSVQSPEADANAERDFAVIESMAWRCHVTKSDLDFAAFSGPQHLPEREHVIYVTNIPDDYRMKRGYELAKALARKGVGGARATILENGAKALVEFADAEIAENEGRRALEEIFQSSRIEEYSVFREEMKDRRDRAVHSRRSQSRSRNRSLPYAEPQTKRPRHEAGVSEPIHTTNNFKCTIM